MNRTTVNPAHDVSLRTLNTLGIEARAHCLLPVTSSAVLQEGLAFAREHQLPLLVLGQGSNMVLTRDWPGLVLKNELPGFEVLEETAGHVIVALGGGECWHDCVERTVNRGWYGLENLALIPGTVGAAPVQNIGAYGREISELVIAVEAISLANGKPHRFSNADCQFRYRDSIFRGHLPNRWLITRLELRLSKQAQARTTYPALEQQLRAQGIDPASAHPQQVMQAVIAIRRAKLPDPAITPNAGSFFKNPLVSDAQYQRLLRDWPALVAYPFEGGWKLAAGWLIDQAGYRGITRDGVGTAPEQALVITNPGHCPGSTVMQLAAEITRAVQDRFGVSLEVEPLVV